MNRWLDRGVDGFRMDVISLLAKASAVAGWNGKRLCVSRVFCVPAQAARLSAGNAKGVLLTGGTVCVWGKPALLPHRTSFRGRRRAELDMLFQFDVMDMDGGETSADARPFDLMRLKQIISAWQAAIGWNTLFWQSRSAAPGLPGLAVRGQRRCTGGAPHVLPLPCIS